MYNKRVLLCFVMSSNSGGHLWPYPSGLLHWPVKQPWRIWLSRPITNHCNVVCNMQQLCIRVYVQVWWFDMYSNFYPHIYFCVTTLALWRAYAPVPVKLLLRVWVNPQWNKNVVVVTKFSSVAALEAVILTTPTSTFSNENFIKMTTFAFQCTRSPESSKNDWHNQIIAK